LSSPAVIIREDAKRNAALQGIKITAQPGFGLWKRMNYIPSFETTHLNTLIVGGGNVGLEKLSFVKIESKRYC
jgi:hypothetical protein